MLVMINRASTRQQIMKKPKLGSGKRFKQLTSKLKKKGAKPKSSWSLDRSQEIWTKEIC